MTQQALVRYSDRRQGRQIASVRAPKEKDDRGNVVTWLVYPERHWTPANREKWLSVREARLWQGMKDWRIVQTREVEDDKGGDESMLEALVRYVGRRRGSFRQRVGRFPVREWAGRKSEIWLSREEAELWDKQKDWRIMRTRIIKEESQVDATQVAAPAPPAQHVSTLLEEAKEHVQRITQQREEQEAAFAMSSTGVVHRQGCVNWPKYPTKTFDTFADAVNDPDFAKAHKLCCKGEMAMLKQQSEMEQFKGAMAQMNTLGESYGVQAKET